MSRCAPLVAAALTLVVTSVVTSPAWAHAYPATTTPAAGARLDAPPAHIGITYDDTIVNSGSTITLLDATGSPVPVTGDPPSSNPRLSSITPTTDLSQGPYTVAWVSLDATDGHANPGFFTFVVNGGPVGIIHGSARAQLPAADLLATLTVGAMDDGSSLLRVDLNNTSGVQRVRLRLQRPDLGIDLLDTRPTGDGGWMLASNEVAVPGAWQAAVIVRRQNVVDDAEADFTVQVDPTTGEPTVS